MGIKVVDHHHEPALVLQGVGAEKQLLLIQTGTLVFELPGSLDEGWQYQQLTYPVAELPSDSFGMRVRSIATAAPASVRYAPPAVTTAEASGLLAEGDLVVQVGVSEHQVAFKQRLSLPVKGTLTVPLPMGGWAVDRTEAQSAGRVVQLVVDLAVYGPVALMRLAYSVFVTMGLPTAHDS